VRGERRGVKWAGTRRWAGRGSRSTGRRWAGWAEKGGTVRGRERFFSKCFLLKPFQKFKHFKLSSKFPNKL
jgi:hypothetical protein